MKIVILADSITTQSSGIHYYGIQFIERLISTFPENEYHIIATKEITNFKIKHTIVPLNKFPFHLRFRQLFLFPKLIKKIKPDHVIELAHFGPFRLDKRIKRSTVIHDLTPINFPQFHTRLSNWMHRLLLPGLIKKADTLIVNSTLTKSDVHNYKAISKGKTSIIFPTINIPKETKKGKYVNEDYILTVGTIEPRKNYELILEGFKNIGKQNDKIKLIIVGSMGWKMEHFEKLIDEHPYKERIIITGFVSREELWSYYQNAKLFIFATHYEGFGIPILEACYHGLPLVLSKLSTSEEIAENAAEYFEKNNAEDLSKRVVTILSQSKKREIMSVESKKQFAKIEEKAAIQLKQWYSNIS